MRRGRGGYPPQWQRQYTYMNQPRLVSNVFVYSFLNKLCVRFFFSGYPPGIPCNPSFPPPNFNPWYPPPPPHQYNSFPPIPASSQNRLPHACCPSNNNFQPRPHRAGPPRLKRPLTTMNWKERCLADPWADLDPTPTPSESGDRLITNAANQRHTVLFAPQPHREKETVSDPSKC